MGLYDVLAGLPLTIDRVRLERRELAVTSGFTRVTTVVRLGGDGVEGVGEDVTYDGVEHHDPPAPPLEGAWTSLDELSQRLDELDLFGHPPGHAASRDYRRWGYESAALDLALRQAGRRLADALGRTPRAVRFVVSLRLPEPVSPGPASPEPPPPEAPSPEAVLRWLELDPALRFKLDPTATWDAPLVEALAATGAVEAVDLKGAYRGTVVDNPADPRLYRLVAEGFPGAWIEDPDLTGEAGLVLEPHRDRITWDAPIHGVADIEALPFPPRMLNIKPSRFGTLRRLLDAYEYCEREGIGTYGGGQFELGPGRSQIQYLASMFSPDAPNDVAPGGYNAGEPRPGLPSSPLPAAAASTGFRWGETGTDS